LTHAQDKHMQESENSPNPGDGTRHFGAYTLLLIVLSLATIGGAFWLSNAAIDEQSRLMGFSSLIVVFVVLCVAVYLWRVRKKRPRAVRIIDFEEDVTDADVEKPLAELDEAREFFAGSLKLADAFRLMSNRVKDVMPFQAIVLYVLNEKRTHFKAVHADWMEIEVIDDGLANQSLSSGCVEIDSYLEMDSSQTFESSAAIPLRTDGTIFAALQLYFGGDYDAASVDKYLFEAVGERVAPLILSSLAYERSHANALTDVTTELPNERAFYLMLEKQIAESHNNHSDDPLTVLAIDIKNFEEINAKFGHATGDQVLNFVARIAKDNLRQMDFLARSINDEFLAILPTASTEISQMIIERIHNAFNERKFDVNDGESIEIELNIGWATYENEGKTPGELLSFAELKKEQLKMPFSENVVAFPQEFVQ
jgi:diguanylate cyclase (GGDEF)-like protein